MIEINGMSEFLVKHDGEYPRCDFCDRPAQYQCDGNLVIFDHRIIQCDAYLCELHRNRISEIIGMHGHSIFGPFHYSDAIDYCPICQEKYEKNRITHKLASSMAEAEAISRDHQAKIKAYKIRNLDSRSD